ncbi:universal stress protein [Thiothrix subterranea]|uniref:Universal stress protein n=1 Tax=Thiothrix subterranea TaxID=2735563 RepID=A0AA51MQ94_9GAMM|nr:universal stress protein [Thiothrix subterranea]MDQ5769298.1 universal stress protein [Thiothrix subterranea]WML86281.1 universal stress protein [Thiothrix subterranea]
MLPEIKTILYATDLKEQGSKNVFKMAVSLAKSTGAHIVMLHVAEVPSANVEHMLANVLSEEAFQDMKSKGLQTYKDQMESRLQAFCEEECNDSNQHHYPGGKPTVIVEEGRPARTILRLAEEHQADLIVMGCRHHSTLGQALLGSIANKVAYRSKIPVMIYPI